MKKLNKGLITLIILQLYSLQVQYLNNWCINWYIILIPSIIYLILLLINGIKWLYNLIVDKILKDIADDRIN